MATPPPATPAPLPQLPTGQQDSLDPEQAAAIALEAMGGATDATPMDTAGDTAGGQAEEQAAGAKDGTEVEVVFDPSLFNPSPEPDEVDYTDGGEVAAAATPGTAATPADPTSSSSKSPSEASPERVRSAEDLPPHEDPAQARGQQWHASRTIGGS